MRKDALVVQLCMEVSKQQIISNKYQVDEVISFNCRANGLLSPKSGRNGKGAPIPGYILNLSPCTSRVDKSAQGFLRQQMLLLPSFPWFSYQSFIPLRHTASCSFEGASVTRMIHLRSLVAGNMLAFFIWFKSRFCSFPELTVISTFSKGIPGQLNYLHAEAEEAASPRLQKERLKFSAKIKKSRIGKVIFERSRFFSKVAEGVIQSHAFTNVLRIIQDCH